LEEKSPTCKRGRSLPAQLIAAHYLTVLEQFLTYWLISRIIGYYLGLDASPLRGADRNLVLSPEQNADMNYQVLAPGRAYGKINKQNSHKTRCRFDNWESTIQHCLSVVKTVWSFTNCIRATLNINDDDNKKAEFTKRFLIIFKHKKPMQAVTSITWRTSSSVAPGRPYRIFSMTVVANRTGS